MKKVLILTLVLCMIPVVALASFSDVPKNHWAYDCINELKSQGVVNGYEDGSFRPDGNVTRAETAKILCDIASLPEGDAKYEDVTEKDWFYNYVRDCGEYIESGSRFDGNRNMTREGVASAIVLIKGATAENADTAKKFSDYEGFENPEHISAAVEMGFISGYEDGSFKPLSPVTRAEICSMIMRAFANEEESEVEAEPAEKTWSLTRLAHADLENFKTDAVLGFYNELIFLEDETDEILFKINIEDEEIKRETMWRFPAFFLRPDAANEESGYSGFVPHSLVFDNTDLKTIVFGKFTGYKAPDGTVYDVNKYSGLDITYRLFDYAQFEDGKVQGEDKETCIPELLYIHNENYSVVYDGKSSVYRFNRDTGIREGRLYYGTADTYRGFLSLGGRMFGVDNSFNLKEYDFENMKWMEPIRTFDADFMGTRDNKFWLWDAEGGRIYTSTPDGKETTVHNDVSILNVELEEGLDQKVLNSHMLVYDKDTFILYDGTHFLKLEKK